MLLQITQICFHQSEYVTLHSDMNIYDRKRRRETAAILVLSYYYVAPVGKVSSPS